MGVNSSLDRRCKHNHIHDSELRHFPEWYYLLQGLQMQHRHHSLQGAIQTNMHRSFQLLLYWLYLQMQIQQYQLIMLMPAQKSPVFS